MIDLNQPLEYHLDGVWHPATIIGSYNGTLVIGVENHIRHITIDGIDTIWKDFIRNKPITKTGYFSIYSSGVGSLHPTRATADRAAGIGNRKACIKITYKGGQFDE